MDSKSVLNEPGPRDHVLDNKLAIVPDKELPKPGEELPKKEKTWKSDYPKRGLVYYPKQGMALNPLKTWGRNEECFCGSHKKFKKCHEEKLEHAIPEELCPPLLGMIKTFKSGVKVPAVEVLDVYLLKEFRNGARGRVEDIAGAEKDSGADRIGIHIPPAEGRSDEDEPGVYPGGLQENGVPRSGSGAAESGVVSVPDEVGRGVDGRDSGDRAEPGDPESEGFLSRIASLVGLK